MKNQLPAKIAKLPVWAREHIETIERERNTAIDHLNEWVDNQTKSPFFFSDLLCLGEDGQRKPSTKKVYVQTHHMTVKHAGVRMDITLRGGRIDIQYRDTEELTEAVNMTPQSFQSIRLSSIK